MILTINDTREEFDNKLREIREISESQSKANMAIGSFYDDSELNIRKALHKADEDMYQDKQEYYARHPEFRYR